MESVILSMIRGNHLNLKNQFNNLCEKDKESILNLSVCLFGGKIITDNTLFTILYNINGSFDINMINKYVDPKSISYKYVIIGIKKKRLSNKINLTIKEFQNCSGKLKYLFKNCETHIEFKNVLMSDVRLIAESFDDSMFTSCLSIDNVVNEKNQEWYSIQVNEIICRLKNLINLFGCNLLRDLKIPLMTFEEFRELTFKQKSEYYMNCTRRLYGSIEDIINLIKEYSEIEHKFCIIQKHYYAITYDD